MPKEITGIAGRKPPEPSTHHEDIQHWLRRQMPDLQGIVRQLDEEIRAALTDLEYAVINKVGVLRQRKSWMDD